MTGPLIALVGYAFVALVIAVLASGILPNAARVSPERAHWLAALGWCLAMAPPIMGFVADVVRAPVTCTTGECYDYILWWLAIPIGWLLAAGFLTTAVVLGRRPAGSTG